MATVVPIGPRLQARAGKHAGHQTEPGGDAGAAEHARRLFNLGFVTAAEQEAERWLSECRGSGDLAGQAAALNALGAMRWHQRDYEGAIERLHQGLRASARTGGLERAKILTNLSLCYLATGQPADAETAAASALDVTQLPPPLAGQALLARGLALIDTGRHDEAGAPLTQALALYRECRDRRGIVKALNNLGVLELERGAFRAAHEHLSEALALAQDGDQRDLAYICTELGRLLLAAKRPAEAMVAANRALDALLTEAGSLDRAEVARICELYGHIFAGEGDRAAALKHLNRAAAYFAQMGMSREWDRTTARIRAVMEQPDQHGEYHAAGVREQLEFLTGILQLSDELEAVNPLLRGHGERVAACAVAIAPSLGVPPAALRSLKQAARLHDVGMIAVDPEVLSAPGPLTDAQREELRAHVQHADSLLASFRLHPDVMSAVRHHHERFDGTGYPDGLSGEDIPLLARILAVCGAYDALVHDRPHRKALPHREALRALLQMSGSELCPRCVDAFVRLAGGTP